MVDQAPSQDSTTRWIETSRGILSYSQLALLLAERVLRVQEQIESGAYAADAPSVTGAMVYGATKKEAVAKVEALVRRILAEKVRLRTDA